jgi:DNA (cytosine-5)-methyltransferase 1
VRELHLFAGIGGGILAGQLLGHRCVGAVELDPYCREVLRARQADGSLDPFPVHDDVRAFRAIHWVGQVDIVCGGFPCQDISLAGTGAGLAGARSGLWFEMLRIVREVAPAYVFVENVRALVRRGLGAVLGGLADLGFDAEWEVLSAAAVGACHRRERLWILAAHPDRVRQRARQSDGKQVAGPQGMVATPADTDSQRCDVSRLEEPAGQQGAPRHHADRRGAATAPVADADREAGRREAGATIEASSAGAVEPRTSQPGRCSCATANAGRALLAQWQGTQGERALAATRGGRWGPAVGALRRADDGPADTLDRVARLTAIGNAQVPLQAATAFRILMARFQ